MMHDNTSLSSPFRGPMQLLLSEKNLIVREEAVRNGLLFGGFSGVYHAMRCMLRRYLDRDMPSHSYVPRKCTSNAIVKHKDVVYDVCPPTRMPVANGCSNMELDYSTGSTRTGTRVLSQLYGIRL